MNEQKPLEFNPQDIGKHQPLAYHQMYSPNIRLYVVPVIVQLIEEDQKMIQ